MAHGSTRRTRTLRRKHHQSPILFCCQSHSFTNLINLQQFNYLGQAHVRNPRNRREARSRNPRRRRQQSGSAGRTRRHRGQPRHG